MYKAKDIMSSPAISITENHTLQEVLDLMAKNNFSGLPVVDTDNKIIGIISNTDIIRYSQQSSVIPLSNLSGWISPYADISDLASVRKGFDMLGKTKTAQVMTKKVYTVTGDTDAKEIALLMNRRQINRVPVVDNDGKLIGIVTRGDMVQCMAKL
jgi:CBS domain-containing protein